MVYREAALLTFLLSLGTCWAKTATITAHHLIPETVPDESTEPPSPAPTEAEPVASYSNKNGNWACPRREDIHPCTCIEVPGKVAGEVETVALCRNIRNQKVLSDSMKGFQHHRIDYFVLDSCKLPPFPNGLMHNVDVKWIEVLNSTVQFQNDFLSCSKGCL